MGKKTELAEDLLFKFNTLQPLYNTIRYNTVLDITRFKDGTQKMYRLY